jgi:hypothetical protein
MFGTPFIRHDPLGDLFKDPFIRTLVEGTIEILGRVAVCAEEEKKDEELKFVPSKVVEPQRLPGPGGTDGSRSH